MKSCPAVDPLTGLVIVGSHDGHVYALNPEVRTFNRKTCKGSNLSMGNQRRRMCYMFPGAAVCMEASLWGRSRFFLHLPPHLAQAAVCGFTGGSAALSQPCESIKHQTSVKHIVG